MLVKRTPGKQVFCRYKCHRTLELNIKFHQLCPAAVTSFPVKTLWLWFNLIVLIIAWISDCICYKVRDEINFHFPNFESTTALSHTLLVYDYSSMLGLKVIYVSEKSSAKMTTILSRPQCVENKKTNKIMSSLRWSLVRINVQTLSVPMLGNSSVERLCHTNVYLRCPNHAPAFYRARW